METSFSFLEARQLAGNPFTPPGVTPNYVNPPWRGAQVVIASSVLTFLATVSVSLRLFSIKYRGLRFGWDDYLIIPALILAIGRTVANSINATHFDLGIHIWDINPEDLASIGNEQKNTLYAADMLYLIGIMFTKESILAFYLKIFKVKRWFRIACISVMVLVAVYCWLFFFLYAFNCTPVWVTWHTIGYTGNGYCRSNIDVNFAVGGINIATDLIILLLPLPVIATLKMDPRKKWALIPVFGTGVFVWATTITREVIVVKTLRNVDQTWDTVPEIVWLTVELNVGIICANLPSLSPVLYSKTAREMATSLKSLVSRKLARSNSLQAPNDDNSPKGSDSEFSDKRHGPITRELHDIDDIEVDEVKSVDIGANANASMHESKALQV